MKDVKSVLNADKIEAVVLDLDGTLYDKRGLAGRMVRRLWWCLPLLAADRMARGQFWLAIVRTHWHRHVYLPTMVDLIGKFHHPRPEALHLIEECKKQGIKMAVYSDYGCVAEKLAALHIDASQFEVLVDAPSLGLLKPSAKAAQRVLEMLGAAPQKTLFVGDRDEKDGKAARGVGAKFLLIED